jgi:iron complex transport system ATP-binding protein
MKFRPVRYRIVGGTLLIELGSAHRVLSSAPRGGGFTIARSILNHQVPANPAGRSPAVPAAKIRWSDPSRYLGTVGRRVEATPPFVGLMTAVPMKQLVVLRDKQGDLWVECYCTVGVTNAVKAGEPPVHDDASKVVSRQGTMNLIIVTNAKLSRSAMVGVIQVATESKTGTLRDCRVRSATGLAMATGTGTDAVVIASPQAGPIKMTYSGTHTVIGSMIGRLIERAVRIGLKRSARWHSRRLYRNAGRRA